MSKYNTYTHSHEKKKSSKDTAMKLHCRSRFKQRFGIDLTKNIMEYMIAQIVKHKSTFVCTQTNTRSVHIVNVLDKNMKVAVVYNKQRKLIHTVFPIEWITNGTFDQRQKERKYINCVDYN